MLNTIPASAIVQVTPSVLAAGGRALDIIGLLLTTSARVPIDVVQAFSNQTDVADYFGDESTEAALAAIYFNGYDKSYIKPAKITFAQYNTASVAAWLRGGQISTLTLAQLKAIPTGALTVEVNGSGYTAALVDLSTATSFSNAAQIIQTAFGSGVCPSVFSVGYDSVAGAFTLTTTLTGSGATIDYAETNALATNLMLTAAEGAVTSQGAAPQTPEAFMTNVAQITQNWATFMTCWDPDSEGDNTNKLLFMQWTARQNNRYAYICWDTDDAPKTISPAPTSLGYLAQQSEYSGTCLMYAPTASYAAFICGAAASIDFTRHNARITFAFKSQSGMTPDVLSQSEADNLIANGYNFYGAYSTANDLFIFMYPGSVTGDFKWLDSYINQIWLNAQFQLAFMVLLTNAPSIPYNHEGYSLIEAAAADVINQGLNFGAFRAGVTLSQAQAAEVNNAAGVDIATVLNQRGWYFQVADANPQVRQQRGSPPCTFWYMDGQSVQKINLASIELM